ncbi:MAG TPA: hypothetical protein VGZ71_07385, partial [Puia sp.]|nr:hypothetical protein [Puia sp.]
LEEFIFFVFNILFLIKSKPIFIHPGNSKILIPFPRSLKHMVENPLLCWYIWRQREGLSP